MEFNDYYAILGVDKTASQDEIQRAYRKLARNYHPDVNKEAGAEDTFKDLGEADEVLKDPERRETYDRYGSAWRAAQQNGGAPPPGYEDVGFDISGAPDDAFSGFSGLAAFSSNSLAAGRVAAAPGATRGLAFGRDRGAGIWLARIKKRAYHSAWKRLRRVGRVSSR